MHPLNPPPERTRAAPPGEAPDGARMPLGSGAQDLSDISRVQRNPATDPFLGAILDGTYRVEARIAEGGMAAVYQGVHLRLGTPVAIKVLSAHLLDHPTAVTRFRREAAALSRLRSEHVVRVLDTAEWEHDGVCRPCLITELLRGEDLQCMLKKRGKLPVVEALRITRDLAQGLAAAHAAGVVHRDLKPSNVFLQEGRAILIDFGVAHVADDTRVTKTGSVVGTPPYMPPEQIRGAESTPATDLYGLGAVLYRAAVGHAPYRGKSSTEVLSKVLDGAPPAPSQGNPSIPYEVEMLILELMTRDAKRRPQAVDTLIAKLDELIKANDASSVTTPTPLGTLSASLAAGLLAVAVATAATGAWRALGILIFVALVVPARNSNKLTRALFSGSATFFAGLGLAASLAILELSPLAGTLVASPEAIAPWLLLCALGASLMQWMAGQWMRT